MTSQTVLRTALWLSLGTWIGAWAFFGFVVSRLAFQVLPGDLAGEMAGALLSVLHYGGATAAFLVVGAGIALGRRGWVIGLPVLLGLLCLGTELFLSPQVAAVSPISLGPDNTVETQQRFALLHRTSLVLFMTIHVASIVLVWGHARLETLAARGEA
ncbi:MAG: DUF4149 domain-containing protein [Myxococcota bacterium]